jgi:hypothetical protein
MAVKKELKIHNKSDKPDNIILKENEIMESARRSRMSFRAL